MKNQASLMITDRPVSGEDAERRSDTEVFASSGCTKDTLVLTSEGCFHSDGLYCLNKKPEVITRDGFAVKSGGVASGGIQDIFGLLTDSAYLKGAAFHRVLRITPECISEMTELTALRKGDFVVYQKGIPGSGAPVYHDDCLDVSDAQELGKHISSMSISNRLGSELYHSDKFHNKNGYFSVSVYNILKKFDNFTYRVPEKLLCASEEFIAAYLRGYFDGGTRYHLNRITAAAACRELASDIVCLLSLFGIKGKITKLHPGFEVVISDAQDIHLFIKEIGFLNSHDFSGCRSEPAVSGVDYKKLCDEYRLKASESSLNVRALPETIAELIRELGEYKDNFIRLGMEHKFNTLALLSHAGCRATEVTEYAKYTGREEVFGVINIAEAHTWCANGLVVSDRGESEKSDETEG
ncbi:hypothetical protein CSM81_22835 [Salmonella enterica subsp. enterica serovar Infantis]|nr:hypothetical protein [Salmonella enterica subsp. enterica serovar Infantis]